MDGSVPGTDGALLERADASPWSLKAQIEAAGGLLDGMVIWGDVAYGKDVFFSPNFWRKRFKPGVKAIVDVAHAHGLPVIYHGCGNVNRVFEDFIEVGVDGYNPLEAKAGLDVVELRRSTATGWPSAATWTRSPGPPPRWTSWKTMVLTKLNAAKYHL